MASTAANAWTPLDILTLSFTTVRFSMTESVPEQMVITTKGYGKTQEEAVNAAIQDAVQKAIGILVISEQIGRAHV